VHDTYTRRHSCTGEEELGGFCIPVLGSYVNRKEAALQQQEED
jgi:hypothetical protein